MKCCRFLDEKWQLTSELIILASALLSTSDYLYVTFLHIFLLNCNQFVAIV